MKQKTTILTAITALMATMTIALILSCDSDDLFGLDEQQQTAQTSMTRAGIDMSEYLELSTYDYTAWSNDDYRIISTAIERMGLSYNKDKHRYQFNIDKNSNINISDSLYAMIIDMAEYSNSILFVNKKKIKRRKTRNSDAVGVVPDCVPVALSHIASPVYQQPTYDAVVAVCDSIDSHWRSQGGVKTSKVYSVISCFAPTYPLGPNGMVSSMDTVQLSKCVMLIDKGGDIDHAVNAVYFVSNQNHPSRSLIFYLDYTSGSVNEKKPKFITPSEMTLIFPFV